MPVQILLQSLPRVADIKNAEAGTTLMTSGSVYSAASHGCGYWYCIQSLGASQLASGSVDPNNSGATLTGLSLTDRTRLYGSFTAVQLISGTVLAYKSDGASPIRL